MIELNEFCVQLNGRNERVSSICSDLHALYEYVGLQSSSSMSLSAVTDALYTQIANAIGKKQPIKMKPKVTQLLNELILKHVIDGLPLQPHARTIEIIRDALHPAIADHPHDDQVDWGCAVQAALDYSALRQWSDDEMFENSHSRPFAVARAALSLKHEGYEVSVQQDRILLEPASEGRLTARISELVRLIGGLNVAGRILNVLRPLYDWLSGN